MFNVPLDNLTEDDIVLLDGDYDEVEILFYTLWYHWT